MQEIDRSGFQFTVSGTGCVPGTYTTPQTLQWLPGAACLVQFVSPQYQQPWRLGFVKWMDSSTQNPRLFTAPSQPAIYTAEFLTEYRLTVTVVPTGAGTVTAPEWVHYDTEALLTATPAPGFRLAGFHGSLITETGSTAKIKVINDTSVVAVFVAASTALDSRYTVVPVLGGGTLALNNYGQVAASQLDATNVWTPDSANTAEGSIARVPAPSTIASSVLMNEHGQIVRNSLSGSAALWSPSVARGASGTAVALAVPAPATALNDFGQIAGSQYLWTPSTANGSSGTFTSDARFLGLADLNNSGQAVMFTEGYVGGVLTRLVTVFSPSTPRGTTGTFTNLPALASGRYQSVVAINESGAVTGTVCAPLTDCEARMFIWRPSSPGGNSGTLEVVTPPAGFGTMIPTSMNDSGDVVGKMYYSSSVLTFFVPFLYRNGVVYDLSSAHRAFRAGERPRINNAGQIAFESDGFAGLATPAAAVTPPASNAIPVTIRSESRLRVFSVSGAGCQPGTYFVPETLRWTPGAACTVSFASPQGLSPDWRHRFSRWQDGVIANPRVFTAPGAAAEYTAVFSDEFFVRADISPAGAGTVSGTGWFTPGATATLKATPASGYRFLAWSGGRGTSETITLTVESPLALTALFAAEVPASPVYAVVPIDTSMRALGRRVINDYGQVLVENQSESRAALWTPHTANGITGTLTNLSALTGHVLYSPRINGRGQIAGNAAGGRLILWSPTSPNTLSGSVSAIETPGFAGPAAINAYGQIAGPWYVWTPSVGNGPSGTLVANSTIWPGVADLNDSGQMLISLSTGWRLFTPATRGSATGTASDLPFPIINNSVMVALNSSGLVAGYQCAGYTDAVCNARSFIYNPAGGPDATVNLPLPPGFTSITASAMNDRGDVVGTLWSPPGFTAPFLYTNGILYDLSRVHAVTAGAMPVAINNSGQIVINVFTADSRYNVYLLTPLPPGTPVVPLSVELSPAAVRVAGVLSEFGVARGQQEVQVALRGTSAAAVSWSVSPNNNWLTVWPRSGTGDGKINVSFEVFNAVPGTMEGTVTITAGTLTKTLRVQLVLVSGSATQPPFGVVDTPKNNETVSGAVGVTGWALDDIEVERIEVWRKALPGEPNIAGQVYVGRGIFLEGARPDVAKAYPGIPLNTRAGWGMQILTNMLPNTTPSASRGNGEHELFAYAFDIQGKSKLLGSRIIVVNNQTAVKPFGTIDTPESGGTVSGTLVNFGWALTPVPGIIPADGSTMWVFVDGVAQGHPVYNNKRPDIASLFPGYANTDGAVGYYHLNTTALTNGMHSIAWSVTDNLGRVEGIGSRLFFVQNAGVAAASTPSPKGLRAAEREGVWYRAGYNPDAPLQKLEGSEITIEHMGRIELHIAGAASVEFNGSGALPIGATFENGVFYWQLDPAFIASYELKFRAGDGAELNRVAVRVTR